MYVHGQNNLEIVNNQIIVINNPPILSAGQSCDSTIFDNKPIPCHQFKLPEKIPNTVELTNLVFWGVIESGKENDNFKLRLETVDKKYPSASIKIKTVSKNIKNIIYEYKGEIEKPITLHKGVEYKISIVSENEKTSWKWLKSYSHANSEPSYYSVIEDILIKNSINESIRNSILDILRSNGSDTYSTSISTAIKILLNKINGGDLIHEKIKEILNNTDPYRNDCYNSCNQKFSYTLICKIPEEWIYKKGDVDHDGKLTVIDALFIAYYITGIQLNKNIDIELADYNEDGGVTMADSVAIAKALGEL